MLARTGELLEAAREGGYAVGGFNVYNLEGARAVVGAAEAERSPVMLQIHPSALRHGGPPLVALCLSAAREAAVPVGVHLDHAGSVDAVRSGLAAGLRSVMADGSTLPYDENVDFIRCVAKVAHEHEAGAAVEAELGRLSGTEDGLTVAEYEARLTDPRKAAAFVRRTRIDALAVCIGNVHGPYRGEPRLDFDRLAAIRRAVSIPLVLHGASGLREDSVRRAVRLGVCKLNVNTELREAYLGALRGELDRPDRPDLLDVMNAAEDAMQSVVEEKVQVFGSAGKA